MEVRPAIHGIPSKAVLVPLQVAHRLLPLVFVHLQLGPKRWVASYPQLEYAAHLVCVRPLGELVEQDA